MSAVPTPLPGAATWHVETGSMWPAVMDKLAQLSDQVRWLRDETEVLRLELRALRFAVLGFVSVVVLGLAGFGLVAWLR